MKMVFDFKGAGLEKLKDVPAASRRALQRAAASAKVDAARAIAEDTGLPVGKVKESITTVAPDAFSAEVHVKGGRVPLIDFKARGPEPSRGRGAGVSYRLPGGRGRDPNAFIATMPGSGHRGVFKRLGAGRNPIAESFGPSLAVVFQKFFPAVAERAVAVLRGRLAHEVKRILARRG